MLKTLLQINKIVYSTKINTYTYTQCVNFFLYFRGSSHKGVVSHCLPLFTAIFTAVIVHVAAHKHFDSRANEIQSDDVQFAGGGGYTTSLGNDGATDGGEVRGYPRHVHARTYREPPEPRNPRIVRIVPVAADLRVTSSTRQTAVTALRPRDRQQAPVVRATT